MGDGDARRFAIGEVADAVGMSVHALRFYEDAELLVAPIERDSGGRRRYRAADVEWLRICTRLRASGCRWPSSNGSPPSSETRIGRRLPAGR